MAIDATGPPTPLGIPKFDTSADNPSGKGGNAQMDALDTLLAARIVKPGSPSNGQALVWNGSSWIGAFVKPSQLAQEAATNGQVLAWNNGGGIYQPTDVNTLVTPTASVPAGALVQYGGSSAPTGWLLCDGTAVSRATYAALFAVLAGTYGTGDGSTTFNLPDLRGRMAVGLGTNAAVNALGTNDGVAIANRRGAKHRHTAHNHGDHSHSGTTGNDSPDHTHGVDLGQSGGGGAYPQVVTSAGFSTAFTSGGASARHTHAFTTGGMSAIASVDGGSGNANDPLDGGGFLVVNFIIKT